MNLTPFTERLREQLVAAADAAGDDQREVAERLVRALEPAVRLALLDALSFAADEITSELAPGSVEVRLRGGDPEFAVQVPVADAPVDPLGVSLPPAPAPGPSSEGDAPIARINLRLPQDLKERVDEAAGGERLSTNEWLVRLIAAAMASPDRHAPSRRGRPGQSYTGWVS